MVSRVSRATAHGKSALARRCCAMAAAAERPRVATVYGTFCQGSSRFDAEDIYDFAADDAFDVSTPQDGFQFKFDSLQETQFLLVSTSSWLGMPPPDFAEFAHQLLLAAQTNPGCLSHMQHAVWGRGDERWFRTYMSVPRYVDALLSECGSRRFFARGETGEPHAPTGTAECQIDQWAPAMWEAMRSAEAAATAGTPAVAWDALWSPLVRSPHHEEIVEFELEAIVQRYGALQHGVSKLARPERLPLYQGLLDEFERKRLETEEFRQRQTAERERHRIARGGQTGGGGTSIGAAGSGAGADSVSLESRAELLRASGVGKRTAEEVVASRTGLLSSQKPGSDEGGGL